MNKLRNFLFKFPIEEDDENKKIDYFEILFAHKICLINNLFLMVLLIFFFVVELANSQEYHFFLILIITTFGIFAFKLFVVKKSKFLIFLQIFICIELHATIILLSKHKKLYRN